MADPLSSTTADNKASQSSHSVLLNELDDLQNNVISSTSTAKTLAPAKRPHSQSSISPDRNNSNNNTQLGARHTHQHATNNDHKHNHTKKKNVTRAMSLMNESGQQIVDQLATLNSFDDDDNDVAAELQHEREHAVDAERYSWRPTVLCGLFKDEYDGAHGRLHNESAMLKCDAIYVASNDSLCVEGELCLTNFLLYFVPHNATDIAGGIKHVMLPIACIAKIDTNVRNNVTEIVLTDRIYRCVKFRFQSDKQVNYISSDKVLQMLRAVCFPTRMIDLFAFEYFKNHPCRQQQQQQQQQQQLFSNSHNTSLHSLSNTSSFMNTSHSQVLNDNSNYFDDMKSESASVAYSSTTTTVPMMQLQQQQTSRPPNSTTSLIKAVPLETMPHCFVIYDFDGTVFAERLYHTLAKECKKGDGFDASEIAVGKVISQGREKIIERWGGSQHVSRMRAHFAWIRKQGRAYVRTALHTFHQKRIIRHLFDSIEQDYTEWFDELICSEHEIQKELLDGRSYSKNLMLTRVSHEYNVDLSRMLYIDDDPKLERNVRCCDVYCTQTRKGMNSTDVDEVQHQIAEKMTAHSRVSIANGNMNGNMNMNHQNVYDPTNAYKYEQCAGCSQAFDPRMLLCSGGIYICSSCHAQQPRV